MRQFVLFSAVLVVAAIGGVGIWYSHQGNSFRAPQPPASQNALTLAETPVPSVPSGPVTTTSENQAGAPASKREGAMARATRHRGPAAAEPLVAVGDKPPRLRVVLDAHEQRIARELESLTIAQRLALVEAELKQRGIDVQ